MVLEGSNSIRSAGYQWDRRKRANPGNATGPHGEQTRKSPTTKGAVKRVRQTLESAVSRFANPQLLAGFQPWELVGGCAGKPVIQQVGKPAHGVRRPGCC